MRACLLALLVLVAGRGAAQDYPIKPIRLLVGFAPGGAVDLVARILQPRLAEAFGKEIIVENRAGAAGVVAADATAKAAPDGYTLCLVNHGALVISPAMMAIPYNPRADLTPIARVVELQNVFLTRPTLNARTLMDLVAIGKDRETTLSYATSGNGSAGHLAGELLTRTAGITWLHIPYRGGGPAMTDFLSGQVDVFVATTSTAIPYVKQGRVRALAVSGKRRTLALPEVPTVAESGWPDFEASAWFAVVAPANLPRQIRDRWQREVARALALPEIRQALVDRGMDAFPSTSEELTNYLEAEAAKWGTVVRDLGLRPN